MPKRRSLLWPVVSALVGILLLLVAVPQEWKGWAPAFLRSPALHLGLDLAGGTQLDFRISEEEIDSQLNQLNNQIDTLKQNNGDAQRITRLQNEKQAIETQRSNLVEAIRLVIERRINALGVSEASITPSYIGSEKHILVECPGIIDTQECINVVGKTIQLEFKEEFTEPTAEYIQSIKARADASMHRIAQSGSNLQKEGQDLSDKLGVIFINRHTFFRDTLPHGLEGIWTQSPGKIIRTEGSITVPKTGDQGQQGIEEVPGIFIAEVLGPRTQTGRVVNEAPKAFTLLSQSEKGVTYLAHPETALEKNMDIRIAGTLRGMKPGDLKTVTMDAGTARIIFLRAFTKGGEQIEASHILISYKGASVAGPEVTRSKDEALAKVKELKSRLDKGADFHALALAESDGPSRKDGGRLGAFTRGTMVPAFEEIAFKLPVARVSDPVETQFGYHLIRVDKGITVSPDRAVFDELTVSGPAGAGEKRADELLARLQHGKVTTTEEILPLRTLFFSLKPTGWKDTQLNGKHFRTASVAVDPVTNIPVVQIAFDDEGGRLFGELTKKNVGKRIAIFVGGELVSAPVVQTEITGGIAVITGSKNFEEARKLAQDLNTGAIPAPIYLVGQYTIEATLGSAALRTSLQAALLGTVLLMLWMILIYRVLGVIADIALTLYAIMFFALLKLPLLLITSNYIVLTLAGMAGIILSIGMAVDANVLVFERMKEELKKGKLIKTAVEASFTHAWPAIRDGNISTIITCAILFLVGTSIVRGFAVTLALGTVMSLFTAVVVTRFLMRKFASMPMAQNPAVFGVKMAADPLPPEEQS